MGQRSGRTLCRSGGDLSCRLGQQHDRDHALAEIINLRQARKRRARAEKQDKARERRLAHGRSKAERQREEAQREKAEADLERHRLEEPDET